MASAEQDGHSYMLLVKQDAEFAGSNTWWMRGEVEAVSAEAAVRKEYDGTYLSPNRRGNRIRRDRVAVTGPDTVWQEFEVVLRAKPADIVGIEPRSRSKEKD